MLCLCIVGLAGLFVLRPSLTAAEADALKRTYSEAGPGADRSGALPAGEEPASFVDFSSLRADYPDVKGWLTIPGTVVDYPVLQSSAAQPEYYLRRNYRGEWRMAGQSVFSVRLHAAEQKHGDLRPQHDGRKYVRRAGKV